MLYERHRAEISDGITLFYTRTHTHTSSLKYTVTHRRKHTHYASPLLRSLVRMCCVSLRPQFINIFPRYFWVVVLFIFFHLSCVLCVVRSRAVCLCLYTFRIRRREHIIFMSGRVFRPCVSVISFIVFSFHLTHIIVAFVLVRCG